MIEGPKNSSERQDSMQRIQVGVIGLVAVLLLVGIANFVLQRASDEQTAIEVIQAEATGSAAQTSEKPAEAAPSEPLADLGITPTRVPEGVQPVPEVPVKRVQVVPDLEPDPKLEAPMDQER